jgi:hypothetical protein
MRPSLDPASHRVPRMKPTCLIHTWRPHRQRPFALVLHLHQHESSRNLHLQYLAKNQSTQRCQSLITQGSDHPPVLEPHMVLVEAPTIWTLHTSPTHFPSWPRPRSHWSATGPRNKQPTSQTWERSGTQTSSLTDLHRSGQWPPPVRPVPAEETWLLPQNSSYTSRADVAHWSDRFKPESRCDPQILRSGACVDLGGQIPWLGNLVPGTVDLILNWGLIYIFDSWR